MKTLKTEEEEEPVAKRSPFALYGAIAVCGAGNPRMAAFAAPLRARPRERNRTRKPPPSRLLLRASGGRQTARLPNHRLRNLRYETSSLRNPPRPLLAATAGPAGRSVWRVVAYTYKGKTKAEDMVAKINEKHSDLGAEVYTPPRRSGDYLVTVGGAMDHDEATKMLDKARREGLPADSYVQNFSK